MSNGTPPAVNVSSDPYQRGFHTGCLIGCAPLILLFVGGLVLTSGVFYHFSDFDDGAPVESSAEVALPEFSETTTVESLLPKPPKPHTAPVYIGEDLSCVPLLSLESGESAATEDWKNRKAHTVAAALHLNQKVQDGYLKLVLSKRPDLAGLPFAMGDDCRSPEDSAMAFIEAAEAVRSSSGAALVAEPEPDAEVKYDRETFYKAHMAVASQVIPAESVAGKKSLIRGLASIPRPEATRRLARLAVYSPDKELRNAALEALAMRRSEDVADVLVSGLRYPWPGVAENAATAIVKLKRKDLIPQLEAVLDAPDPRAPKLETVAGKKEAVAYELVRVNHLHNCLLCHPPVQRPDEGAETNFLSAEVAVPSIPVPDNSTAYYRPESNLLVRIDVTYLRPEFSAIQHVEDWTAHAWTSEQRFDFLLRRRVLSSAEADDLRKRLSGESPYRRAAVRALRSLTGKKITLKPAT